MYRKRINLSQDEIAYLLGCRFGTKVARYERFTREPSLRTALACEVIFRAPLNELFGGIYEQVERDALKRARRLVRRLGTKQKSQPKLAALKAIIEPSFDSVRYEPVRRQ